MVSSRNIRIFFEGVNFVLRICPIGSSTLFWLIKFTSSMIKDKRCESLSRSLDKTFKGVCLNRFEDY